LHSLSDSAKVYFVSNMNYTMKIKGTLHSLSDSAKVYFVSNMNYTMKIKGVKQLKAKKFLILNSTGAKVPKKAKAKSRLYSLDSNNRIQKKNTQVWRTNMKVTSLRRHQIVI